MNYEKFAASLESSFDRIALMLEQFQLPKSTVHPPVDPSYPYESVYRGLHTAKSRGQQRPYYYHIPMGYPCCGAGVFVFLDEAPTQKTLEMWSSLSEQFRFIPLLLAPGAGGWDAEDPTADLAYGDDVMLDVAGREFFAVNDSSQYVIGLGRGAQVATLFALLYSSVVAGLVMDGGEASAEALELVGRLPCDGDPKTPKSSLPMNAWVLGRGRGDALVEYLWRANKPEETSLRDDCAQVYRSSDAQMRTLSDGDPVCELRLSEDGAPALQGADRLAAMLAFLLRVRRWSGIRNGDIRVDKSCGQMGLKRFEKRVNGLLRHWYVYEPSVLKRQPGRPCPLVVAVHGYSCTGEIFAKNTLWHEVAEARGFMVVYPTAYPGLFRGCCPLPKWNGGDFKDERVLEDEAFLLALVEEIKAGWNIDPQRVYITGHSNGSAMTQAMMAHAPEVFAAFGPVGMMHGELDLASSVPYKWKGLPMPVWYIKGDHDVGGSLLEEGTPNLAAIRASCKANGVDAEQGLCYENGAYSHRMYLDGAHRPLVRYTAIRDFPHQYTPEIARMLWDEFFCRYRRLPGGEVEYIG